MKVILASRSPQRKEILARLGFKFDVTAPEVEEFVGADPERAILDNAVRKARAVARSRALVIGCDTDVVIDDRALGKPEDEAQARQCLRLLSGREHTVISGLAVVAPDGEERTGVARSGVVFRDLGDETIERYVASGEWRERAGGYAIQGLGSTLVAGVVGDVANVIGLPLGLLLELAPELVSG